MHIISQEQKTETESWYAIFKKQREVDPGRGGGVASDLDNLRSRWEGRVEEGMGSSRREDRANTADGTPVGKLHPKSRDLREGQRGGMGGGGRERKKEGGGSGGGKRGGGGSSSPNLTSRARDFPETESGRGRSKRSGCSPESGMDWGGCRRAYRISCRNLG